MTGDPLGEIEPRTIGARLREAREARGLTQQQAAQGLGVARTTMVAIEKGERRVQSEELVRLARLYGRQVSDLLQRDAPVGLEPLTATAELLPARFIALAMEAWAEGQLSEGQLARLLRVSRLEARERMEALRRAGPETPPAPDLSAPLVRSATG